MILGEEDVLKIVKASQEVPGWISVGRDDSLELSALVNGDNFSDLLIKRIEQIEQKQKAVARERYSRDIRDFYDRILSLLSHVYNATGGSKSYEIKDSIKEDVAETISNSRSGKTLEQWLQVNWMKNVYQTDPNGVIFLEYTEKRNPYPIYKSIHDIRNYECDGQKLEWILFEPSKFDDVMVWRLVDDLTDWTIIQRDDTFNVLFETINIDGVDILGSFDNPFRLVPGRVNSDIEKVGKKYKLSPVEGIVPISKEYARDQSIKTLYKFLHGFPMFWRYFQVCNTCAGTGKVGNDKCPDCDGKGKYISKDITDDILVPLPHQNEKTVTPDIAGYVSPPLDVWDQYKFELKDLEDLAFVSMWGSVMKGEAKETATKTFIDKQPVLVRLSDFGDVAENMEKFFSELIVNFFDQSKEANESQVIIHYGKGYIIEPIEVLRERYEKAKKEGDNNVILDQTYSEWLIAKYKNDPKVLQEMMIKSAVEPYLHLTMDQVEKFYGQREAQKKGLFHDWWVEQTDVVSQEKGVLEEKFNKWFNENATVVTVEGED